MPTFKGCWLKGHYRNQRSTVWIPSSYWTYFYLFIIHRNGEGIEKEVSNGTIGMTERKMYEKSLPSYRQKIYEEKWPHLSPLSSHQSMISSLKGYWDLLMGPPHPTPHSLLSLSLSLCTPWGHNELLMFQEMALTWKIVSNCFHIFFLTSATTSFWASCRSFKLGTR